MKNILIFGSFSVRDWELNRQRQQTLVDFLVKDFNVFYIERINPKTVGIRVIVKAFIKRLISVRNIKKSLTNEKRLHFIQLIIFPFQKGIFRFIQG